MHAHRTQDNNCDYSIIVPAYNEAELLPRTLEALTSSVAAISTHTGEIVVVDNNSTDDTPHIAQRMGARVVFEPVNQISRARNAGAAAARGRYFIFIDADTTAPAELIEAVLAALDSGAVCGGGARIGTSEPLPPMVRRSLDSWNWLSQRRRWAAGSFVYCHRDAWDAVGGFSDKVYAAEEIYFSKAMNRWARKHGQEFRILPIAVDTSMRKMQWYTFRHLLSRLILLAIFPWLNRSRRFCRIWYERPDAKG